MNTATQTAGVNPKANGMSEPKDTTLTEYIPHGGLDAIKLSLSIIKNLIAVPTKSGKTCGDRDAMRFLMLCRGKRLNPFEGDCFLVGYDGKDGAVFSLITAHQAFLKRAESHQDYKGMDSGVVILDADGVATDRKGDFHLKTETVAGGWALVHRKDRIPTYRRLAMEQRKPNYPSQFWEGNKAAEQIVKCAEADALRSTFPTMLGGLYTGEEMTNEPSRADGNGFEVAASKLVATTDRPALPERGEPAIAETPETQLMEFVTESGFSLDSLRDGGSAAGIISQSDADKITDWNDVPTGVAARLLRNKPGLLKALQEHGGQHS